MTDPTPAHAGVHFPPPLIYAITLAVGWLLGRWHPWPITGGPSVGRLAVAAVGAVLSLWLAIGAMVAFRRARTTIIPNRPATAMVDAGPYRFTRNPMYLSLVALYLGGALLLDSWWPVLLLPVLVLVVDRMVIAREERYLATAFPAEYAEYRARVRRWL